MFTAIIFLSSANYPNFILVNLNLFKCKYLALAFSIYFVKNKQYKVKRLCFQLCTCSGMCLSLNWYNCKLNLYVFLSALYMLWSVPIVKLILVIVYLFKKKKKKKKRKEKHLVLQYG